MQQVYWSNGLSVKILGRVGANEFGVFRQTTGQNRQFAKIKQCSICSKNAVLEQFTPKNR